MMSREQMPPEFDWIKPGVKATCQKTMRNVVITRLPDNSYDGFGGVDWFVCWRYDGRVYGGSNCNDLIQGHHGSLTLTLTREQAEALLKGVEEIRWCCRSKPVTELKKQIEEKLK